MQITDPHFNSLDLSAATRLSVCSICQRFQIPYDAKRDELTDTMVYRARGWIGQSANSRVPETNRPWCTDCRLVHFEAKRKAIQEAA